VFRRNPCSDNDCRRRCCAGDGRHGGANDVRHYERRLIDDNGGAIATSLGATCNDGGGFDYDHNGTATTSTLPVSALVLRGDGLGVVSFADPMEDAMAILVDLFGPPSYGIVREWQFVPRRL